MVTAKTLIPGSATLKVEFKSDVRKCPDEKIFEACVAMANTNGGSLYLGVEDDGTPTGLHKDHLRSTTVEALIANHTIPQLSVRATTIGTGPLVLQIEVPKARSNVVATTGGRALRRQLKADGTPENVIMYPQEILSRITSLHVVDYSARVLRGASIEDLDPAEMGRLRQMLDQYDGEEALKGLSDEQLLLALNMGHLESGRITPTVAGILLIGKRDALRTQVPTARSVFQELNGDTVLKNEDFFLPVLASVERMLLYLDARNQETEWMRGAVRSGIPAYDSQALREAVVNAYSHRDYAIMGRVRVTVQPHDVTIANPGALSSGISLADLISAEPQGRNPTLADALQRIGLAERTGRGIDRIFEGSLRYGSLPPDYSSSNSDRVSVVIPRIVPDKDLMTRSANAVAALGTALEIFELVVLNALDGTRPAGIAQLIQKTGLSENALLRALDRLTSAGVIIEVESGRFLTNPLGQTERTRVPDMHASLAAPEKELLDYLQANETGASTGQVADRFGISRSTAYRRLSKLVQRGVVETAGSGKHTKYVVEKETVQNTQRPNSGT